MTLFVTNFLCANANKCVLNTSDTLSKSSTLTLSKVYDDVKMGLVGLSGALKVPAAHVYSILVKQQVVNSFVYLFCFILTISIFVCFILCIKKMGDEDEGEYLYDVLSTVSGALLFVLVIVTLCVFCDMIIGFINPEYGAIKYIMNFIK